MQSWWLTEEAAPDFGAVEVDAARRRDRRCRNHRHLRCADVRRSGKARSRPRRPRRRRRRERAQRRLRAARRRDAVRPRADIARRRTRHRAVAADGGAPRSARAARRRRDPTDRQPPSRRRTMRNATRSAPSSRRSARTASRRSGIPNRCAVAFPRRSFIRATRPRSRRGWFGDSRCSRRKPASRSPRTTASIRSTSSTPSTCSSRRTATRAACSVALEGTIVPTRGQVIATEPIRRASVPVPALRPPRLRLLAADTRRPDRRRRLPRRRARVGVHGRGADHADDPGRAGHVRRGARRTSDPDLASLGRHLRIGARPAPRSSGACRARIARGSQPATRATATCSDSPAAMLVARAMLGDEHPLLGTFDPVRVGKRGPGVHV